MITFTSHFGLNYVDVADMGRPCLVYTLTSMFSVHMDGRPYLLCTWTSMCGDHLDVHVWCTPSSSIPLYKTQGYIEVFFVPLQC